MWYILQGAQLTTGNTFRIIESIIIILDELILDLQWKTLLLGFTLFSDNVL
jgi:hypothetical protein